MPWYCAGYEEKMVGLNPCEKCVMVGVDLIKRSIKQQKLSKFPEKVLTILFEDMVQDPYEQLKRIESFIGRAQTDYTEKFVKTARCPRILDPNDRKNKLQIFQDNINAKLFKSLVGVSELYEKNTYGLL